jgi:opacity protein-like surface antigen
MQRITPLVLLAASLVGAPAFAQKTPFEGLSLGLNVGLDSGTTELGVGDNQINGLGWTSQGLGIQGAWGWPAGGTAIFSLGATLNLTDIAGGDANTTAGFAALKRRTAFSVYMEPGLKLFDRTLAYLKVGYEGASMHFDASTGSADQYIEGAGYGLGLRSFVDKHIYLQAEVKQVFYSSTNLPGQSNSFKSSGTQGLLGLGYQF